MSIDDARNHLHAAMLEAPDHPYWEQARDQEAAEDAGREAAWRVDQSCESVEAEESKWFHPTAGIFARMARERPWVHYSDGTGP